MGGRRSDADVGSTLEGEKEVAGAIMGCAVWSVRVGAFGTVGNFGLGTDGDLNTGEFLVEGYFLRGEVRGRDIHKPDVVGL